MLVKYVRMGLLVWWLSGEKMSRRFEVQTPVCTNGIYFAACVAWVFCFSRNTEVFEWNLKLVVERKWWTILGGVGVIWGEK